MPVSEACRAQARLIREVDRQFCEAMDNATPKIMPLLVDTRPHDPQWREKMQQRIKERMCHMEDEELYFGQVAYEAYCATTDWKSAVTGDPLPQFSEQKDEIKRAWKAAGKAVREALLKRIDNHLP